MRWRCSQVVASWDRLQQDDATPPEYNVIEVKPGEPLTYMQDMDGSAGAALASGQESDSSSTTRGRKKKKGKEEWKPFARQGSLSPAPRRKREPRRMQSMPRVRTMPIMKTPLKDILHKQREQEEEEQSEQGSVFHSGTDISCHVNRNLSASSFIPQPR